MSLRSPFAAALITILAAALLGWGVIAQITPHGPKGTRNVLLAWDPSPSSTATGYLMEQLTSPSTNWVAVAGVPAGQTSLWVTVSVPGTYAWRVLATNWWAASEPSNEVQTPGVPAPAGTIRMITVTTVTTEVQLTQP